MLWLDELCDAIEAICSPFPVAPFKAPVRIELAPVVSLLILVESIDSSLVRTAASMTFLIRLSSVVNVKSAS